MKIAYIDTSVIVAILFNERGGKAMRRSLQKLDAVFSSNLLEAELRSVFVREAIDIQFASASLDAVRWVLPDRPLNPEISAVLKQGYLRGADAWHLACALYLSPRSSDLLFLTLDVPQKKIAAKLGFSVKE
ncbi:MAG: type II toxin-antitoxin system VapC family toxin [Deltaproteobacteria bacterium]|nr:type II toxin-antitoxin system VapC family toxin [Deltaproteobacteria bacterium]